VLDERYTQIYGTLLHEPCSETNSEFCKLAREPYLLLLILPNMGGVTGFLNIVAATGGAALLLYSTDALFYYTDER